MATLNGGISSTSELIRVSGTPPPPGSYVTIDSEAIRINGAARGAQGRNFTRDYLAVDRGVAGTTKATHSNGATLTPYYPDAPGGTGSGGVTVTDGDHTVSPATTIQFPTGTMTDLGGGVASVGLVWRLVGPFRVTVGDVGLVNPSDPVNGIPTLVVPDGSLYRAVVLAFTTFDQDCQLTVAIGPSGNNLAGYKTAGGQPAGVELLVDSGFANADNVAQNAPKFAIADGAVTLYVAVWPLADSPTVGAVDVYAIIATPAS